ncbi:MAG: hypothetical protein O3A87_11665 [Verrucomicrobia bacterium]|nr:hypothetical protein [Verrucomicrobiota bacterium]
MRDLITSMKEQFILLVHFTIARLLVPRQSGRRTMICNSWLDAALVRFATFLTTPHPALARIRATRPR